MPRKIAIPNTVEIGANTWNIAKASVFVVSSITAGYVVLKVWAAERRAQKEESTDTENEDDSQIIRINRGTLTDDIIFKLSSTEMQALSEVPHLNLKEIRASMELLNQRRMFRPRAASAPCLPFSHLDRLHPPLNRDLLIFQNTTSVGHDATEKKEENEEISDEIEDDESTQSIDEEEEESKDDTEDSIVIQAYRRMAGRNHSTTVLDWPTVFEQHQDQMEDIADNLPIIIGEEIEVGALKVVNEHIARRLTRLFRKYCKSEILLLHFDDFMQLVRDYLEAAKTWVPRYIQTVTMVKLRMSVASVAHNPDFNKAKAAEEVSTVLAPYLMECFKVIRLQIDAMSDDDEVDFICRFCFEQMKKTEDDETFKIPANYIDCQSFIQIFPTLMESLFEFQKLIPAFREGVSKAQAPSISVSLNKHIGAPQQGDELLEDGDFAERWCQALEEMELEEYTK